jgi:hypothetical protein
VPFSTITTGIPACAHETLGAHGGVAETVAQISGHRRRSSVSETESTGGKREDDSKTGSSKFAHCFLQDFYDAQLFSNRRDC